MLYRAETDEDTLHSIKKIIAQEAIFFPQEKFEKRLQATDKHPHLILSANGFRMRRANKEMWNKYISEGKATEEDRKKRRTALVNLEDSQETIYVTDNANDRFKSTFKGAGLEFAPGKYEICHIGNATVHDPATFGAIPNLVFLPRWIASATDHLVKIQDFLLEKSYSLYHSAMQESMKDFEVDKFFLLLCNNDKGRFSSIQAHADADKYQWKKTDRK